MHSSHQKTIDIMNAIPDIEEVVEAVYEIVRARGFVPEPIHDAFVDGEDMVFFVPHKVHRSVRILVPVTLSFRKIVTDREKYLQSVLIHEKRRFANDNQPA